MNYSLLIAGLLVTVSSFASTTKSSVIYTCALMSHQAPADAIKANKDRLEVRKVANHSYDVLGTGKLARVNASKDVAQAFVHLSAGSSDDDSTFRLISASRDENDSLTVYYDTDAGSKGATLVASEESFDLQCVTE